MSPRRNPNLPQAPSWLTDIGIPAECISQQSSVGDDHAKFRIQKAPGDELWCVQVDGGWITSEERKVDYLFYCSSGNGVKKILLVELKGRHFTDALTQIRSTLRQICKKGHHAGIHTGAHQNAPGHEDTRAGGVRAYVIVSKFRGTNLDQIEIKNIARDYKVIVQTKSQIMNVRGVDQVP